MRRPAMLAAWAVAILSAAFVLGPREPVDTSLRPLALPADLDTYLDSGEGMIPHLRAGTEKHIRWSRGRGVRTPAALVYLHGYSASRQETDPLLPLAAEALGANVYYTRLSGHGREGSALAAARVNDWLNDAWEAYTIGTRLGDRVIVVGTSTGATLAAWLASSPQAQALAGMVLISPNFGVPDPAAEFLLLPWARHLAPLIRGPTHAWAPLNPAHGWYWTTCYPTQALVPLMALVEHVRRQPLERIRIPVLTLYSPRDRVIDVARVREAHGRLGSTHKPLVPITEAEDPAQHVLAGAILSPGTTQHLATLLTDFVRSIP